MLLATNTALKNTYIGRSREKAVTRKGLKRDCKRNK